MRETTDEKTPLEWEVRELAGCVRLLVPTMPIAQRREEFEVSEETKEMPEIHVDLSKGAQ